MQTTSYPIGVILLTADYRVVGMNRFAMRILGLQPGAMGKSVYDYHPPSTHSKIAALLEGSTHSSTELPVAMVLDVLGKVLMMSISPLVMLEDPSPGYLVASFVDVTRQTGAKRNPASGVVELKRMPIYERGQLLFLDPAEIFFVRSDGNYCELITARGTHYIHGTLKSLLGRLPGASFMRVHKSYGANLSRITALRRERGGQTVAVFDDPAIPPVPVARRRLARLKQALGIG